MHQTQKNGEAARCISPNRYSIVKVQEPESRVHRKVQARVREGADENVPQGNASAAYFTIFLNVQGQGKAFRSERTPMGAAFPEKPLRLRMGSCHLRGDPAHANSHSRSWRRGNCYP
jgi:hypothetical protein